MLKDNLFFLEYTKNGFTEAVFELTLDEWIPGEEIEM